MCSRARRLGFLGILVLAGSAFGGAPELVQEFKDPAGGFSVRVPARWKNMSEGKRGYLLLMDFGPSMASVMVLHSPRQSADVPAFIAAQITRFREKQKNWAETGRAQAQVSGFASTRIQATYELEMGKVQSDSYLVLTPRSEYVVSFMGPPHTFAGMAATFEAIIGNVRFADQPEAAAGPVEIQEPNGLYRVTLPAGWRPVGGAGGQGAQSPDGEANVTVTHIPLGAGGLDKFVNQVVDFYKQSVPEWTEIARRPVEVCGHKGVHIRSTNKPGGRPLVADTYMVATPQHIMSLVLQCDQLQFVRYAGVFNGIVAGWSIGGQAAVQPVPTPRPPTPPPPLPAHTPPALQPPTPEPPRPVQWKQYSDLGKLISFRAPDDWKVTPLNAAANGQSPDLKANFSIMVTVRVPMPLAQWGQMCIASAQQQYPGWRPLRQGMVTLSGGPAYHIQGQGPVDGAETVTDTVLLQAGQYQALLVVSALKATYPQAQKTLWTILQSFRLGQ